MKNWLILVTGLMLVSCAPLKSYAQRAGLAYHTDKVQEISKNRIEVLGIETILLKIEPHERVDIELEAGFYTNTYLFPKLMYSRMQINLGAKYKWLKNSDWQIGTKIAVGGASKYYKREGEYKNEKRSIPKIATLNVEREVNILGKRDLSLKVSKEIFTKIWIIGVRISLSSKNRHNFNPNHDPTPWP